MEKMLHTNRFLTLISDNFKLLSITTIIILIYYYYTKNFDYFKKRNVKYIKPVIFFGSNVLGFFALKSQAMVMRNYYDTFKDQAFGGFFEGRSPRYILCDPNLIKTISVSDGDHFIDRSSVESNEAGYSSRSLLMLKGGEWKAVRSLITPTFSSARLKNMFPLIQTCCNQLVDLIARHDKNDIELKAFTGHLTLEVTGVCAFGISTDILKDENAEYYKLAAGNSYMSMPKRIFFFSMLLLMPSMLKYIPISVLDDETNRKLVKIIQNSKAERRSGSSKRSDLLQLLVDASLQEKEELLKGGRPNKIYLDDDTIDAQALLFLQAGFGTTCILLTYALFTLALHTDIQDKLRAHILEVTKGKELSYDRLVELEYLESILNETLRMYPPVARIDRCCSKPYTIPGTSLDLKVGDVVVIPVYGLHMDPKFYPEPEIFKPDRFMKNGKLDRLPDSFLAFGSGPRYCIGRRFSMVVAKAAMVTLLTNFKFTICPKTIYPLGISKTEVLFNPEEGAWVRVEKI